MYFWIRLIIYFLTTWRRKPLDPPFDVSRLHYRAWPTDIDASMHMNNSRYAVLADMGRFDLVYRMGIGRVVVKEGFIPVLMFASIRYRREIRNLDPFTVESRILSWDDTNIFIEHKFTLTGGKHAGQAAALMIVKSGLYSRKDRAFIPCDALLKRVGLSVEAPPLPDAVKALLAADEAFQQVTSGENAEKRSA